MPKKTSDETKKSKQLITTKAFITILIIITLIAVITVTLLVYLSKQNNSSVKSPSSLEGDFALKNRYETYNINSLTLTEKNKKIDGLEYRYYTIAGLKNKQIQNQINEEIYATAINLTNQSTIYFKDNVAGINVNINSNFNNILSISFTCLNLDNCFDTTLNYDLTTGRQIAFKDIFIDGYNPQQIIATQIYETFLINGVYEIQYEDVDAKPEAIDIEAETLKRISEYQKGNFHFDITQREITLYFQIDSDYYDVYYLDILAKPEVYAIFKRFLTKESIFIEDNAKLKDIPIGVYPEMLHYDGRFEEGYFGKILDNAFFDIAIINSEETTMDDKTQQIVINGIKSYYKNYASQLPNDKAVIMLGRSKIEPTPWRDNVAINQINIAVLDKDYFDSLFPNKIIDILQHGNFFSYLEPQKTNIIYEYNQEVGYDFDEGFLFFDYNGNIVKEMKLANIFKADTNIKELIVNHPDFYREKNLTDEELNNLFEEATYIISPYALTFNHPKHERRMIYLDDDYFINVLK